MEAEGVEEEQARGAVGVRYKRDCLKLLDPVEGEEAGE